MRWWARCTVALGQAARRWSTVVPAAAMIWRCPFLQVRRWPPPGWVEDGAGPFFFSGVRPPFQGTALTTGRCLRGGHPAHPGWRFSGLGGPACGPLPHRVVVPAAGHGFFRPDQVRVPRRSKVFARPKPRPEGKVEGPGTRGGRQRQGEPFADPEGCPAPRSQALWTESGGRWWRGSPGKVPVQSFDDRVVAGPGTGGLVPRPGRAVPASFAWPVGPVLRRPARVFKKQ